MDEGKNKRKLNNPASLKIINISEDHTEIFKKNELNKK
jgi:hypothetical protein